MMSKLKQFVKNQKGFTLVEILVVIVIIGILFTVILPRIDFASDKARQTGVKTDFKTLQTAAEAYIRETSGRNMTLDGFNTYLDHAMRVEGTGSGAGKTDGTALRSAKLDPWGVKYWVSVENQATADGQGQGIIRYWVTGKGQPIVGFTAANAKTNTGGNTQVPDYIGTVYYYKGIIDSCTTGFEAGDIQLQSFNLSTTYAAGGPYAGKPMCGTNVTSLIP